MHPDTIRPAVELTPKQCILQHESRERAIGKILHEEGGRLTDADCKRLHKKYPGYFNEDSSRGLMPLEANATGTYESSVEIFYGEDLEDANW
jgi:hypothetical protein